jgi:hypothetical protein
MLLAAAIAGGVILLAPGINRSKREEAAGGRRARAAAMAAIVRREAVDQRVRFASGHTRDPGLAPPQPRLRAREALVTELEQAITADARARVTSGALTGPILYTSCEPFPPGSASAQTDLLAAVGAYQCLAVNLQVKNRAGTVGAIGDPFWARIDFARPAFAWCKINPRPGEEAVGANAPSVPLAPVCDLERPVPAGF